MATASMEREGVVQDETTGKSVQNYNSILFVKRYFCFDAYISDMRISDMIRIYVNAVIHFGASIVH